MLFLAVGALLMAFFDGPTTRAVGLGVWLLGVMMIVDALFFRDGLAAQCLWGVWVGGCVALYQATDVPRALTDGGAVWVVLAATAVTDLALTLLPVRPRRAAPE